MDTHSVSDKGVVTKREEAQSIVSEAANRLKHNIVYMNEASYEAKCLIWDSVRDVLTERLVDGSTISLAKTAKETPSKSPRIEIETDSRALKSFAIETSPDFRGSVMLSSPDFMARICSGEERS